MVCRLLAWGFVVGLSLASAFACAADLTPQEAIAKVVAFQRVAAAGRGSRVQGPPIHEKAIAVVNDREDPGCYRVNLGSMEATVQKSDGLIRFADFAWRSLDEEKRFPDRWEPESALRESVVKSLCNRYAKAAGYPMSLVCESISLSGKGGVRFGEIGFEVWAHPEYKGVAGHSNVFLTLEYRTGRLLRMSLGPKPPRPPDDLRPTFGAGQAQARALTYAFGEGINRALFQMAPCPVLEFWQPTPADPNARGGRSFVTEQDVALGKAGKSLLVWCDRYVALANPASLDATTTQIYEILLDAKTGRVVHVQRPFGQQTGAAPWKWRDVGAVSAVIMGERRMEVSVGTVHPSVAKPPSDGAPIILVFGRKAMRGSYSAKANLLTATHGGQTRVGVPSPNLAEKLAAFVAQQKPPDGARGVERIR